MRLALSRAHKRGLAVAAAGALAAGGVATLPATPAYAQTACNVNYQVVGEWPGGFQGNITIENLGAAWSSWNLGFSFPSGQQVQQGWGGQFSQSGSQVTVNNEGWNGNVGTGGSIAVGFLGSWNGSNAVPTDFSVNGVACNGAAPTTPPVDPTTPPVDPTTPPVDPTTPPVDPTTPPVDPTTPPGEPHQRVANPYAGASVYVNPDWSAAAQAGGAPASVYNQPTGVWLDRIHAIEHGSAGDNQTGLAGHLDNAVAGGYDTIQVVIYNLPGRDCAALASNGELGPDELDRYESEYIDVIAEIMARPEYSQLRIVTVIEIDSLPNLVTNVEGAAGTEMCRTVQQNGVYVNGVGYALATLGAIPNVYNYVDAAHHGWIGWEDNFGPTAQLLYEAANANGATPANVHGFITNTANFSALNEPYIEVTAETRQSSWIDWNNFNDELTFAQAFRQRLVQAGFSSNVGMLIDTSRNGWGGPNRPTSASTAGDIDTRVDESRVDRRYNKGNWCNQAGAGLGERPQAAPATGIHAFVWIKPPGESDGSSREIPNDEGKGFDEMCDPTYGGNARNGNSMSGALPDAPVSGHWFQEQFDELLRNAYPPLS